MKNKSKRELLFASVYEYFRSVPCVSVTFSLLLWNDRWRVGEGLADLAVCSGVGC